MRVQRTVFDPVERPVPGFMSRFSQIKGVCTSVRKRKVVYRQSAGDRRCGQAEMALDLRSTASLTSCNSFSLSLSSIWLMVSTRDCL